MREKASRYCTVRCQSLSQNGHDTPALSFLSTEDVWRELSRPIATLMVHRCRAPPRYSIPCVYGSLIHTHPGMSLPHMFASNCACEGIPAPLLPLVRDSRANMCRKSRLTSSAAVPDVSTAIDLTDSDNVVRHTLPLRRAESVGSGGWRGRYCACSPAHSLAVPVLLLCVSHRSLPLDSANLPFSCAEETRPTDASLCAQAYETNKVRKASR